MVKAAAEVDADPIGKRLFCGQDGSTGMPQEALYRLVGVWDLHLELFPGGKRSFQQFIDVKVGVDQEEIGFRSWGRGNKVLRRSHAVLQQFLPHQLVFTGGEHVLPDGKAVMLAENQLKGQHRGRREHCRPLP